jgi:hypothetical protein
VDVAKIMLARAMHSDVSDCHLESDQFGKERPRLGKKSRESLPPKLESKRGAYRVSYSATERGVNANPASATIPEERCGENAHLNQQVDAALVKQ